MLLRYYIVFLFFFYDYNQQWIESKFCLSDIVAYLLALSFNMCGKMAKLLDLIHV